MKQTKTVDANPSLAERHGVILTILLLLLSLVALGTIGFMVIEGWPFLDALYMVVITLATVGYREVHPLSPAGTIFTILLIVFGIAILLYVIRLFSEYIIEDKLSETLKFTKMEKTIASLKNHFIVAGFGRVGRQAAQELVQEGADFVVLEKDGDVAQEARDLGYLVLTGDATDEALLKKAAIPHARGLIVATGRDSDNVLIVITARVLNPDIFIVARANREGGVERMTRVGANRVVSPYHIGGFRMATMVLRPAVADFLDDVVDASKTELEIVDLKIQRGSPLIGSTLSANLANRKTGISVLAIHKAEGRAIINPLGDTPLEEGDRLIVMGTENQIKQVEKFFKTAG